jgi:hypothetical protein
MASIATLPKCRLTANGLHGVMFQWIVLFTTTGARNSNLACGFYFSLTISPLFSARITTAAAFLKN